MRTVVAQVYFENGLFGQTGCSFPRIKTLSFDCESFPLAKIGPEIALFTNVTTIVARGCAQFTSVSAAMEVSQIAERRIE